MEASCLVVWRGWEVDGAQKADGGSKSSQAQSKRENDGSKRSCGFHQAGVGFMSVSGVA